MSRAYLEQVVLGDERGAASWVIRALLWPFSIIYRIGLAAYLGIYSSGLRKRYRLPVPVVSVGNVTFGGTGKTPAVEAICRMLIQQGKRVVVLSRGHGGSATGSVIVSGGASIRCDSAECGDEPLALARALPGVAVVVGKDRRASGRLACAELAPDVIVLDDGMQYWQLHRDLDVALVDASRPFGSGFVMPMGDLREPISGLNRAGVVLVNCVVDPDESACVDVERRISRIAPRALALRCAREPAWLRKADGEAVDLYSLRHRRAVVFCGIGRPESFIRTLESLDTAIAEILAFPDHHCYTGKDLGLIDSALTRLDAELVITTEKDFARLGPDAPIRNLHVLGIRLEIKDSRRLTERLARLFDGAGETAPAQETAD